MVKIFGLRILTDHEYLTDIGAARSVGYKLGLATQETDRQNRAIIDGIGIEVSVVSLMERQIAEILIQSQL
jgi:hypothetical protein